MIKPMTSYSTVNFDHTITLDGNTICLDGHSVRIIQDMLTREMSIGCTKITFDALARIWALANEPKQCERVIQSGC